MEKIFTKSLFFLVTFTLFVCGQGFAQTITIGNVDPGPYAPGSTIAVPISETGTCVKSNTTYNLYLSNAAGSFATQTLIGTFNNFYATFVNGMIPAGTPAGNGYQVEVVSANPIVTSTTSAPFAISAGAGVVAGVSSSLINGTYPEVFGTCTGVDGTIYNFVNTSTAGATVTASFYDELKQASAGSLTPTAGGTSFTAMLTHYTITVKAVNSGIVGTKSYLLINNGVNTTFGVTGSNTICLRKGSGTLSYNVDISSTSGIQNNFPGLIYNIQWGDGSSSALTLCDIIASGGIISHPYTQSSCGNSPNGQNNSFEVDLQPSSLYCDKVGTPVTSYANVFMAPINMFTSPVAACTNASVTFTNMSDPGQSQNSPLFNCQNQNGQYTWLVDGKQAAANYSINQNFTTTFTTPGIHSITLHLQNPVGPTCSPDDTTQTICIQNPPIPQFVLPATNVCAPATVTPTDQSVIDNNCNAANQYAWTVTGPAAISYAGGTNANSAQPQFIFTTAGVYQVSLAITTLSCGTVTSPLQTIIVDAPLAINLSPNATFCGTGQTLSFSPAQGPAQTTISGVAQPQANTYAWAVTGGPYSFAAGSAANSEYPQIIFTGFTTYTVTVTVKDNCGTLTKSQNFTFLDAPTMTITPSSTAICPGSSVTLNGVIVGSYTSFSWIGNGSFSAPASLTTNYTPTATEISNGFAIDTLDVKTALAAPCADVQQTVMITIFPVNIISSPSTFQVCTGKAVNYTIGSTVPGSTFSWTAKLQSGTATGFSNNSGPVVGDVLVNNGPGNAVVNYTITPQANGCTGTPFVLIVTVIPQSSVTVSPVNNTICSGSMAGITLTPNITGTTYTWTSTVTGGITGNAQQNAVIGAAAINDVLTNNSNATGTVTYTITPFNGTCPGTQVTATITVQPLAVTANAGANNEVCNLTSYALSGNSPSPGTGNWTVSPAGTVTFNNAALPNATANGLIPGTTYTFTWTITPLAPCPPNSNSIIVTDDAPSVGGTTSGNTTVCAGSNGGTISLTGQFGNITGWQSSTDGFIAAPTPIFNTTTTLQYSNLTQTTEYRAVLQNGLCNPQYSTAATIVVNQPPIQAIAGPDQNLCGAGSVILQGNNPVPFIGTWTQTAGPTAAISSPNNAQTQVTGLVPGNNYTFLWTIKGLSPCTFNADSTHINNANDVIASFTADQTNGCGSYLVNFTNTSTVLTGASFLWDFGDGNTSTVVNPSHTFSAAAGGTDTTYTVLLYVVNNCFQRAPIPLTITVRPQTPVAYISPSQITGCAPFTLTVTNLSPGNNQSYTYYLVAGNGNTVQKITVTNKNPVTFNPITTNVGTQFSLYMIATGFCGNTGQSSVIPITTSPAKIISQMFIENDANSGCVPFTATFINNSVGGDRYIYTIYSDAALKNPIDSVAGGTAPLSYQFNTAGTYYITITTLNSCTNLQSAAVVVYAYPVPLPQFTADVTTGCKSITVNFTNQTPDDPSIKATSLLYDWNFDGKDFYTFTPPAHTFSYQNSPYTITLTATNPVTNCSTVIRKAAYIDVLAPPITQFTEKPDSVTSIPNYSFSFIDGTTGGPESWNWTFGDNKGSTEQNPEHTYPDTGLYKVVLTTINAAGCDSTISHYVRITGVPGQLFLPNAFEPDGEATELKTFMAKGSGIKQWKMQIFNNFSQLMWETTKLNEKGAPVEGWDGTFNGVAMPQGVYIWQVSASFINGTNWSGNVIKDSLPKRVGTIHLIR
jgi:PKD repeat protein